MFNTVWPQQSMRALGCKTTVLSLAIVASDNKFSFSGAKDNQEWKITFFSYGGTPFVRIPPSLSHNQTTISPFILQQCQAIVQKSIPLLNKFIGYIKWRGFFLSRSIQSIKAPFAFPSVAIVLIVRTFIYYAKVI